jgi:hypothetical protein
VILCRHDRLADGSDAQDHIHVFDALGDSLLDRCDVYRGSADCRRDDGECNQQRVGASLHRTDCEAFIAYVNATVQRRERHNRKGFFLLF